MRNKQPALTMPTTATLSTARKWRPILMDQLLCREDHPGDDGTGLMEWLALWQAPKGTLL